MTPDAVNIIDPASRSSRRRDDHVDYLARRATIGREKRHLPPVASQSVPIATHRIRCSTTRLPSVRCCVWASTTISPYGPQWSYRGLAARHACRTSAARAVPTANAATALTAVDALRTRLPIGMGAVREALVAVELPGRFQVLPGRPVRVLDVAHNTQAARALADNLGAMGFHPETRAVFGIMADKDIDDGISVLLPRVDAWLVATLPPPRGATATLLRERLEAAGVAPAAIREFDNPAAAYRAARGASADADRIAVFGSFQTVAAALSA